MKNVLAIVCMMLMSSYVYSENTNDTIRVDLQKIETTYKGKVSFSPKNVVNIVYKFSYDNKQYEIVAFGTPTIIGGTVLKYDVKKALCDNKKIDIKAISVLNNIIENTARIILYK